LSLAASRRIATAFLIAIAGGLLFNYLETPLPWLLGSMSACLLASLARVPQDAPNFVMPPVRVILGVMIGASFTPDIIDQLAVLGLSLVLLVPYLALIGIVCVPYMRRFGGADWPTAYFGAMPGGLVDMVAFGTELGGDARKLALAHSTRVLVIVFAIPFFIEYGWGLPISEIEAFSAPISALAWSDAVMLTITGIVGWWVAKKLRLVGATITGPMIMSALVHVTGYSEASPPDELMKLAQLIIGASIGCAFARSNVLEILRAIWVALGLCLVMALITVVFVALLMAITDLNRVSLLLAYAPGGQGEMNLIALALGQDVAFIAIHHILRIFLIVTAAPLFFAYLERRGGGGRHRT
jgi:membrane AbrB-like protein